VDFFPKVHFPYPQQRSLAKNLILGDDLIPPVLGITENQGPFHSEVVHACPHPGFSLFFWSRCQMGHLKGQIPQYGALPGIDPYRQFDTMGGAQTCCCLIRRWAIHGFYDFIFQIKAIWLSIDLINLH
jgi:hypothetical protein